MNRRLLHLTVENFRTLTRVELPLKPLTVMVGPNAAGKSNVLHVFEFLADISRSGIDASLEALGGYPEVSYRGGARSPASMRIGVQGMWTEHATESEPDSYDISLLYRRRAHGELDEYVLSRNERFVQHPRPDGPAVIELQRTAASVSSQEPANRQTERLVVGRMDSALHTKLALPSNAPSLTAMQTLSEHLRDIRVFDVDVRAARRPSPIGFPGLLLANDASNLADFLMELRGEDDVWEALMDDIRTVLPHIEDIEVRPVTGRGDRVTVLLKERGLRGTTRLADASFGTIRLLCLLTLFHDPHPPVMTCIEEIDHGIHPHALELLALRLREASERTQFLVTTHSPVFVDRLEPEEFVVCERDDLGRSRIPAISTERIHSIIEASEGLPLGELWFSGSVGGSAW
ncbi:AAA family ATPase [Streptomyces sp. NPDC058232]|uniref:AAA family ATPase n=1 Tax=Streptomyces sp. NPDC058232 TaxID=3346393 RepID=UPI0036E57F29